MSPSLPQVIIFLVVAILVFGGRGRISSIMGDMAKGIKSFRTGLKDEDEADPVSKEEMVDITPAKDEASS